MRQAIALREAVYAPPPRAFFKPHFTAVHNLLWESELLFTLPAAQSKLLLLIVRWTSGFQRSWCIMGESLACARAHLSRSALYEAKAALVKRGIIIVGYTKTGCSCYRLASHIQPLIEESAAEDLSIVWESSLADSNVSKNATFSGRKSVCPSTPADHNKDIKEKINTHHQAPAERANDDDVNLTFCSKDELIDESTSRQWVTNAPNLQSSTKEDFQSPEFIAEMEALCTELEKGWATNVRPKSSAAPKAPAKPALTLLQSDLASKLEIFGVNRRIAEKLVLECAPEIVQKALAGLPARKEIAKPAGWLVEEIRSGGYAAPAAIQADTTRRQVAQARQADNLREEARRNAEEAAGAVDRDRLQNLPPDQFVELIEEAINRLPVFIQDRAREKTVDFPPLRAEMVAILRER